MSADGVPSLWKSLRGAGVSIGNGGTREICFLSGLLHSHCSCGVAEGLLGPFLSYSAFPSYFCIPICGPPSYRRKWVDILPDPNSRRVYASPCNSEILDT